MARFGGLFHLCQDLPKVFKKKHRFDKVLHEFRLRLPRVAKNSTAQEWHMTAHEGLDERRRLEIAFRFECEAGQSDRPNLRFSTKPSSRSSELHRVLGCVWTDGQAAPQFQGVRVSGVARKKLLPLSPSRVFLRLVARFCDLCV